jgi:hypothetical protein
VPLSREFTTVGTPARWPPRAFLAKHVDLRLNPLARPETICTAPQLQNRAGLGAGRPREYERSKAVGSPRGEVPVSANGGDQPEPQRQ